MEGESSILRWVIVGWCEERETQNMACDHVRWRRHYFWCSRWHVCGFFAQTCYLLDGICDSLSVGDAFMYVTNASKYIYQFFLEKRVKALILQRSRINDTGTFMFELSSLIFFEKKRREILKKNMLHYRIV